MNEKDDDIESALSGIFSKELINQIKGFKRNRTGEMSSDAFIELASILEKATNEKSEFREFVTANLGTDIFSKMVDVLHNPSEDYVNEEFRNMFNSRKTRKLLKSFLPKEFTGELLSSQTPYDFFMNLTNIGKLSFSGVTDEYSEYTSNCRRAIEELVYDILIDMNKIKTRVEFVKRIENFSDILSLIGSLRDIFYEIEELSYWKENVNLKFIKETALPTYFDLANKYEMVSKFVLIDIDINEGRFNPHMDYMNLTLGQIVLRINKSERFSILGDVDTVIRNALSHGGKYYPLENDKKIRFFDKWRHEDLTFLEVIDKTCRLASLFYVVFSYLMEGHMKEFQMVKELLERKDEG